ncbi:MAG: response regulator transcription factor [Acidobacteriota bacterium]|nr:response regulator transcription factor [Acidobacteriota bacterium]
MRAFIVEDSPVVRDRLIALLSDIQGVEIVGQSGDATEAIKSIRITRPDVVILDIRLSGGYGYDVLRDIRRCESSAVVIIFTNDSFPQSRQWCIDAGADYFLDKATEIEKLMEIFNQLVNTGQNSAEKAFRF